MEILKEQLSIDFSVVEQLPANTVIKSAPQQPNPPSGWIEEYYVVRSRKKHGPYFRYCYRKNGKIKHIYLPKRRLIGTAYNIAHGREPEYIVQFIKMPI